MNGTPEEGKTVAVTPIFPEETGEDLQLRKSSTMTYKTELSTVLIRQRPTH